jgi:hypothetical protein
MAASHLSAVPSLASWIRPPRLVLTLFLGVTALLVAAMGWLAWQVVSQL